MAKGKPVMSMIKLQIPAGAANPAPPVGPALGQHGLNIADFCGQFNARTEKMEKGMKIPVEISVYQDRTFDFITKSPPAAVLLKKAAGIQSGSGRPNSEKVGEVTRAQLEEIAKVKEEDLSAYNLDAAVKILSGTARSMGLIVADTATVAVQDTAEDTAEE